VAYEQEPRFNGKSTYTFSRMVRLAWDAVVSFSSIPLRLASVLGVIVSALGAIYLFYVLLVTEFSSDVVEGWRSVTAAVLFLGGVQLLFLGILGQYVGRMYDDVKSRPRFLVAEDTRDSSDAQRSIDLALLSTADPPSV
jgi:polyisoprenyl-phosphate glycosyltransferase